MKPSSRKPITKKTRFEVFKRDKFKCVYCGKSSPDIILEIDHIEPVSQGGDNSIFNLITSCFDCNRGKGKRQLNNNDVLSKQKIELEKLSEHKEQLIFLKKWRDELSNMDNQIFIYFENLINEMSNNKYCLTDNGKKILKKLIKKYKKEDLQDAILTSFEKYYENDNKSWEDSFNKIPGIIHAKIKEKQNPELKNIYYCRSIIKNRCNYFDKFKSTKIITELFHYYDFEYLKKIFSNIDNWSEFIEITNELLEVFDEK